MAASKKEGTARPASGRYVKIEGVSGRAATGAVETLRAARTAKIASALKQANRKTGLFSVKK